MPQIVFESTEVEFDLLFSSPITVNGWRIIPLTYPVVTFWFSIAIFLCFMVLCCKTSDF